MQGCVVDQGIKTVVGNRVSAGLTRSTTRHLLSSLFLVKGVTKLSPRGSEPPVARTGLILDEKSYRQG